MKITFIIELVELLLKIIDALGNDNKTPEIKDLEIALKRFKDLFHHKKDE